MNPDTIEVSEMFSSLQGEGRRCGYPATFLRLRRCNLACTWCDQKETWDPTNEGYNNYEVLTLWEIRERILDYGNNLLVITGGEPLIWQRQLKRLVESIPLNMSIEIETNGTVAPTELALTRADYNVSPKLANSDNGIRNTDMHLGFLDLYKRKKAVLKYVVSEPKDFEEIELLKHKSYAMIHPVKNEFWEQKDLERQLIEIYKCLLPFNHFLNKAVE